ncbi:MAG: TldD/PmbA family protein [Candidatus Sungbacteria bacterium]|nr:TldD/PmbA family protein [Candidatus Sungbacteria bacterium]
MKSVEELRKACAEALAYLKAQSDIADAQVFMAANKHWLCRLNYTSHIRSNGLEEPKASQNFGTGVTIVFADGKVGSGSAESNTSIDGLREALAKAKIAAVKNPEFHGLPQPEFGKPTLTDYHDNALMGLSNKQFVSIAWEVLRQGLRGAYDVWKTVALSSKKTDIPNPLDLNLIIGGDVQLIRERMAVASFAMPNVQTDESSMTAVSITAMFEKLAAKGSGFFAGKTLNELLHGGPEAARSAINSAAATMSGSRIESGEHTVIFGPQAVAELINNLVAPGLTAGAIFAELSPFQEDFGKMIASPKLCIYDDGANPEFMGVKAITCEGLPTGRTDLVVDGKLAGLLSSHYDYQRMLWDPEGARKLGVDPHEHKEALWPRNGFRFGGGAGRQFSSDPSCSGSNTIVTSSEKEPLENLLQRVKQGVYIGRMWYVYPINGSRAGDFTGTVTADSYLIEDGKLSRPLKPNTVRINDNIKTLLMKIVGVSDQLKPVNLWGADEAMYAPDILVEGVKLESIGESVEMTRSM